MVLRKARSAAVGTVLTAAFAWISVTGVFAGDAGAKLAIPDEDSQKAALELVAEIFEEQWQAAKTSGQRSQLAQAMLDQAATAKDEPAHYFVLLRAARDVAVQAGDVEKALEAVNRIARRFNVDAEQMRTEAVLQAAQAASRADQHTSVVRVAMPMIRDALSRDDYGAANDLRQAAVHCARSCRDASLLKEMVELGDRVRELTEAYGAVKDALALLEKEPTDPQANLAAGRFYCFHKADWAQGIPMMAAGSDAKLKALAEEELRGLAGAKGQLALGDAWFELAEKNAGNVRENILLHAGSWYKRALGGDLRGLLKAKAAKRLEEIAALGRPIPSPSLPSQAPSQGISGTVFEDRNGDGSRDPDEPGLAYREVQLQRVGGEGKLIQRIPNPSRAGYENFGCSIAVAGGRILIGDYDDNAAAQNAGSAYVFDGESGKLLHTLFSPKPVRGNDFGGAVAAAGNDLLVADPEHDEGGTNSGAVFLFHANTGNLLKTFRHPDPAAGDEFGFAVAASEGHVLVGAPKDDSRAGAAFLFDTRSGKLLKTFRKPKPASGDAFGHSVALTDRLVVVGAVADDTGAEDAGAVYVFDRLTGKLLHTLLDPAPAKGDRFASDVGVLGGGVVVGAPGDDACGKDAGNVCLFDLKSGNLSREFKPPKPTPGEGFGRQLAIVAGDVLVGTVAGDSAYWLDGCSGELLMRFVNPKPGTGNLFSRNAVAFGDKVLVSAHGDRTGGDVYVFDGLPEPVSAATDDQGRFRFPPQRPGDYRIRVTPSSDSAGVPSTSSRMIELSDQGPPPAVTIGVTSD